MERIVLVTGGFDPLHSGHIAYFKAAKKLGTKLIVGINSDEWLARKKGKHFMPFHERCSIVEELSVVDQVIGFNDDDDSASNAIFQTLSTHGNIKLVFANGGDRTNTNSPELNAYNNHPNVDFAFGVGGENKANSSSWILKEWAQPTTQRKWGTYKVLDSNGSWRVKELSFDEGQSLSDQKHEHRSEHWHVVKGSILMELDHGNRLTESRIYWEGQSIDIPKGVWHKATNVGSGPAKVIEVWLGDKLEESDIERRD